MAAIPTLTGKRARKDSKDPRTKRKLKYDSSKSPLPFKMEITKNLFLSTAMFNDIEYIHLRWYESTADGNSSYPTKKGVFFTPGRWASFNSIIADVESVIEQRKSNQTVDFKHHIGGGVYVTVGEKSSGVDIRRYFLINDTQTEHPTKAGVFIPFSIWTTLKEIIEKLHIDKPYLMHAIPCFRQPDHANLMVAIECKECSPFDPVTSHPFNFYTTND